MNEAEYTLTARWRGPVLTDNDQGSLKWLVLQTIARKAFNNVSRQIEVTLDEVPKDKVRMLVAVDGSGSGYYGYSLEGDFPIIKKADRPVTGNEAEYMAVLFALESLLKLERRGWKILSDSQLVVNQVRGVWSISEKFSEYVLRIRTLMKEVDAAIEWSPKGFHVGKFVKEMKI